MWEAQNHDNILIIIVNGKIPRISMSDFSEN